MPSVFCFALYMLVYFAFLYLSLYERFSALLAAFLSGLTRRMPVSCTSLSMAAEHYSPIWSMIISWLASEVLFPEAPLCAKSSHSFDMWTSSSWWNAIVMNKWGIASAVGPWTKRTLPSWHANAESCSLPVLPVGPSWKCEEMHIQTSAFWGG